MRRYLKALATTTSLLLCTATPSYAQLTANELLPVCNSKDKAVYSACQTFVMGAIQGMQWGADAAVYQSGMTQPDAMRAQAQQFLQVCDPQSVTNGQRFEIALQYMRSVPKDWHNPAVILIHRALMQAFPCN